MTAVVRSSSDERIFGTDAMKLSAKTEYAALAALELARRVDSPSPVPIRDICASQGVPPRFLVHILLQLKAAGIITSVRGAAGGYRLAKNPAKVTLLDIRNAVEGPEETATFCKGSASESKAAGVLATAWEAAAKAEAKALAHMTLAALAVRCGQPSDPMYFI